MGKFKMSPPSFGKSKPAAKADEFEVIRKNLDEGVMGEANNDGTIFVDVNVEEDSVEEKEVIAHEGQHMKDMKSGKLAYSDDHIEWNGKQYKREDGMIQYNGTWLEEGYKDFPWEKVAYKAGNEHKK